MCSVTRAVTQGSTDRDRGMRNAPPTDPSVPTDLCYVDVGDSLSCSKEFRAHCVDSATHATKTEAECESEVGTDVVTKAEADVVVEAEAGTDVEAEAESGIGIGADAEAGAEVGV